uniref:Uncharacterized protein n=1 Tax=Phenylobacterium glaciei TaxID=2803784 RepID=A0A974P5M2_9CAUL|nr:hypothetical protein JKL49_10485 [Phenylobacterium glaciei]
MSRFAPAFGAADVRGHKLFVNGLDDTIPISRRPCSWPTAGARRATTMSA